MTTLLHVSIILSMISHVSAAPYTSQPMSALSKIDLSDTDHRRLMEALKMLISKQSERQQIETTTGKPRPFSTTSTTKNEKAHERGTILNKNSDSRKEELAELYNLLKERSEVLTTDQPVESTTDITEEHLLKRIQQHVETRSKLHSDSSRGENVELAQRASTSTCKNSNPKFCQVLFSLGRKRSFDDPVINVPAGEMSSYDKRRDRLYNLLKTVADENQKPKRMENSWSQTARRSQQSETWSNNGGSSSIYDELEKIKSLSLLLYQIANEKERRII